MSYFEGQSDAPALASCAVYILVMLVLLGTVIFILVRAVASS